MTNPVGQEARKPRLHWRRSLRNPRCLEFDVDWLQAQVDAHGYSARALARDAEVHEATVRCALAGLPVQPSVLRRLLITLRQAELS